MKIKFQSWPRILPLTFLCITWIIACKDDDKPKLLPEVTTSQVTDITTTTAMGGGEIVSDGNDKITASGIYWSSINNAPTIADSKSELTTSEGSFTSKMENLPSGSTIYVRAYATNSIGTGYGEVAIFNTGNAAPVATSVAVTGQVEVNKNLTGTYTYTDAENNAESVSTIQWYRATDGSGTGETAISGATTATYTLQDTDEFKFIRFGVTPKSSAGNTTGTETKSSFVGPVNVRTTITFTYNGAEVTYGIITSSVTGRKWLDRNLGSPNTPNAYNDYTNYGDLFQWGRAADGHQLIKRGVSNAETSGINPTTITLSISDIPGNPNFIVPSSSPYDWKIVRNDNLWQQNTGANNPCPNGWHIPKQSEWEDENLNLLSDGFGQLKLTTGGARLADSGGFTGTTSRGDYWSSTTTSDPAINIITYSFRTSGKSVVTAVRSAGMLCKCIKD